MDAERIRQAIGYRISSFCSHLWFKTDDWVTDSTSCP